MITKLKSWWYKRRVKNKLRKITGLLSEEVIDAIDKTGEVARRCGITIKEFTAYYKEIIEEGEDKRMNCTHCNSDDTEIRGRHGYYERGKDETELIYVCNNCKKLFYQFDKKERGNGENL